jgi:GGDEF domain-containing protein/capsular polysaccharide biosynthesis protein
LYARWWLLFFPLLLAVILGILVFIFYPNIFEAKASYVIRPRSDLSVEGDFVQAMDTLIGRVEINETFAEIAESKLIRKNAIEKLGISGKDSRYYSAAAYVIVGTNLLEIYARGNDPDTVKAFADAVGEETVLYIDNLYDVFELEPLDKARRPSSPVNFAPWQIFIVFVILGLLISIGLIVFVRFFLHRRKEFPQFVISDPKTGAYNQSFFLMRLREEFQRAGKINNSFAVALIRFIIHDLSFDKYTFEDWDDDMQTIKERLDPYLSEGDILARYDEYTFSFLLLDLSGEEFRQKVYELQEEVRTINPEYALEGRPYQAVGSIGFVYYQYNEIVTNAKEIQDFAEYALDKAVKFNSTRTVELVINFEGEIQENISDL